MRKCIALCEIASGILDLLLCLAILVGLAFYKDEPSATSGWSWQGVFTIPLIVINIMAGINLWRNKNSGYLLSIIAQLTQLVSYRSTGVDTFQFTLYPVVGFFVGYGKKGMGITFTNAFLPTFTTGINLVALGFLISIIVLYKQRITQWSTHYLSSHGYSLKNKRLKTVQSTPWSTVIRFETSEGNIYLKHTPHLLALEAPITQILHDQFHASVPDIIAHNAELDCFLMKEAGTPLRQLLKKQFDTELLCKAIDQFTSLQLSVTDHVNTFLDIGIPDWRLDKLADLFQQLLLQKNMLLTDGLSAKEIRGLETTLPKISNLCKKLSGYTIKPSLVQCDFHDNNLLVNETTQKITMIDLGEIVISHPFFSLIGCLKQAKIHHGLTEESDAYQQLMKACLKNYRTVESEKNLLDAFAIAQVLWLVYEALAQNRLRLACDHAKFMAFQQHGKLSSRLKEFMAVQSG